MAGELFAVTWAQQQLVSEVSRLRYSTALVGGYGTCSFVVTAPVERLRLLLAVGLRKDYREVVVTDRTGRRVFEGFAVSVRFRAGPLVLSRSLATMANAVAVMYTRTSDGAQVMTPWQTDQTSIDTFGRKEYIESASGPLTDALALQMAKTILTVRRYPKPELRLEMSGQPGQLGIEVEAAGYWALASWYYFMSTDQSSADTGTVIWERLQTVGAYTAGMIRTTGVQTSRVQADRAVTVQDAVMRLVKLGDSSFNPIFPQVWEDRRFDLLQVVDLPVIYADAAAGRTYVADQAAPATGVMEVPPWAVRPGWFDAASATVYTGLDAGATDPTRFLVGEAAYDAASGRLTLTPYESSPVDIVLARLGVT